MSNLSLALASISSNLQTSKTMSAKYVWLDTERLVNRLLSLTEPNGNPIFELREIKNTRSKKAGRGKHIVRLRTVKSLNLNGDVLFPEIVIMNSYDGSCPLRVEMGVFRLVCTNGLVVKSKDLGEMKIRHIGTPEQAALDIVKQFAGNLPKFAQAQQRLADRVMNDDEIVDFAMKAAQIRWQRTFTADDAKILLEVARPEDDGNTMWAVMNRVQEKLMSGGYQLSGHKRKTKSVNRPHEDVRINSELFELANTYLPFEMV